MRVEGGVQGERGWRVWVVTRQDDGPPEVVARFKSEDDANAYAARARQRYPRAVFRVEPQR